MGAWLSRMPPAKTGIATYSKAVLEGLSRIGFTGERHRILRRDHRPIRGPEWPGGAPEGKHRMSRRRESVYNTDAVLSSATDRELRAFAEALRHERYRSDPVSWMSERLGASPWSKQREIAFAVLDHRHPAVRACHDSGKSWTAANVAGWWIDTHVRMPKAPGQEAELLAWCDTQCTYEEGVTCPVRALSVRPHSPQ